MTYFKNLICKPTVLFICFIFIFANVAQLFSIVPINVDGNYFDYFTALILWFLSFFSLRLSLRIDLAVQRRLFWFAACLGLAALAFDEVFAFHENIMANHVKADDDYFKVFLLFGASIALYIVFRIEQFTGKQNKLIIIGYIFHVIYILIEIIDDLGIGIDVTMKGFLHYLEEELEFIFLSFYLIAFSQTFESETDC